MQGANYKRMSLRTWWKKKRGGKKTLASKNKVSGGRPISLFGYFFVLEKNFFDFALNPYNSPHNCTSRFCKSIQFCADLWLWAVINYLGLSQSASRPHSVWKAQPEHWEKNPYWWEMACWPTSWYVQVTWIIENEENCLEIEKEIRMLILTFLYNHSELTQ